MGLFKKITALMGKNSEPAESKPVHATKDFSPEILDNPPYTYVDVLHAAKQGNLEKIQDYLAFNSNYVYCKNWEECTLLHHATRFAHKDIVELLLAKGADINLPYKGKTPLHLAIEGDPRDIANKDAEQYLGYRKRRRDTVNTLLSHGADINIPNEAGELPLHVAAKLGYSELVEVLLAQGADVNSRIESKDPKNPTTNEGRTPLLLAAKYNKDKKTIKLLLSKGADASAKDTNPGYAALHYIASHRAAANQTLKEADLKELTGLFIAYKADINVRTGDKKLQTPLHLAINHHHLGVLTTLIESGADVHAQDSKGFMAMSLSARNGDAEMVAYLLSKGTDIYQSRALFHAASCKHSDAALKLLLETGVDINMPDPQGYTPLFSAISSHSLTNVKLLLAKGADTKLHSPKGLTVLEHAFACWGEVENVADDNISEDRKMEASNAKDIIGLLGGFDEKEKTRIF